MCLFTVIWALLIVLPAFLFTRSERSVLETLGKVGVFFVGAKVSMFSLGYFPSTLCCSNRQRYDCTYYQTQTTLAYH
jgi:hypothetical protein